MSYKGNSNGYSSNGSSNSYSSNGASAASSSFPEDVKDVKYYFSLFLTKWYWLLLGLIAAGALCAVHLRYAQKQYKIAGSVLVEDFSQKEMSKDNLAQEFGYEKEDVNMEDRIRIIGSPELMVRVVDSLNLNVNYTQEGKIKSSTFFTKSPLRLLYWNTEGAAKAFDLKVRHYDSLRFTIYHDENNTQLANYGVPFKYQGRELVLKKVGLLTSDNPVTISVTDKYEIADNFRSRLSIEQSGRSNVINMEIVDELPDRGIAVLNRLAQEYSRSLMESRNDAGRRTLNFIDERLNYVSRELYSVEKNVEDFRRDRGLSMEITDISKNYLEKSNLVDNKIVSLENRLSEVQNIERILSSSNAYQSLPLTTEIMNSNALVELITKYNELVSKRSELRASSTDANPVLNNYNDQLNYFKNNILISIQAIKQEVFDQKQRYQQQLMPLEAQLNTMPTNQRELTQIMREQGIKQQLFLYLLQKREETAISVAAQVATSRMLERGTNRGVVSPKKAQLGLFYLFLGLALPAFFFYLKDAFSSKIFQRSEIHKYFQVPFLGFLPRATGVKNRLIINDNRSVLSESFRLIRSNLHHIGSNKDSKIILVTSSVSGEGKSFVATNLALTMAMLGKKVALLGFDLRKPKLEKYLMGDISEEKGLSDFLAGKIPVSKLMREYDRSPNLHFADCGRLPENPTELLMSPKMNELFAFLSPNYDYVIIDAAPIGLVADSFLLREFVEQTIIVTRYGYSSIGDLKFMNEVHLTERLPNMHVLLNDVRQEYRNHYNYGYYSSTYYSNNKTLGKRIKDVFKRKSAAAYKSYN
jgi:tyrosine-protein kinase Etk/Wzc